MRLSLQNLKIPSINQKIFASFQKKVQEKKYGFLRLPDLNPQEILNFAAKNKNRFENILILGIGGSSLGTKALIQALKPNLWNFLSSKERENYPRVFFLDTTDPEPILALKNLLNLKKTLLIVISKSGTTLEPLSLFYYFANLYKKLGKTFYQNNIVLITDPKIGTLRQIGLKDKLPIFHIPPEVGGRFSVLSSVGLLPAALLNINIKKLLSGAKKIDMPIVKTLSSAEFIAEQKLRKNITVIFSYSSRLENLTDWYLQLLAESIGKTEKIGPTPLKAVGPKDQHSLLQLFMEGPKNKLFLFLEAKNDQPKIKIPKTYSYSENDYFTDKTFDQILNAELSGTKQALIEKKCPCLTLTLPKINEETLGQLFTLFELQIALLGELYQINAFNQPGVETGKKITKEILTNS